MINGLQLLAYLPLVNLLFPENMMAVVSVISSIVSFDIPFVDIYTLALPVFGPIFEPPFDDAVLTDYPVGTENFIA